VVPAGTSYPGQTPLTQFHCDLSTGSPVGGTQTSNVICPSFLDPTAVNVVNQAIPLSNTTLAGGQPGWQGVIGNPLNTDEYLGKVDHNWGNDHRMSAGYYTTAGDNTIRAGTSGQGLPWALQKFQWRQHNANVNDTWVISPTKVNQAWVSFTRYFGGRLNISNPALGLAADASLADFGSAITVEGTPSTAEHRCDRILQSDQCHRWPDRREQLLFAARHLQLYPRTAFVQVGRRCYVAKGHPRHAAEQLRNVQL